jgi:ketosteroid isomerase-like protein
MDGEAAARAWIDAWSRAWPARDVDGIAAVYADEARYASHPFRAVETARSYASRAFGEETLLEVRFGEPVVAGDRAAVEYWAVVEADGGQTTVAGASLLRFGADGRVVEHRDYWDQVEGRREPPPWWGR